MERGALLGGSCHGRRRRTVRQIVLGLRLEPAAGVDAVRVGVRLLGEQRRTVLQTA